MISWLRRRFGPLPFEAGGADLPSFAGIPEMYPQKEVQAALRYWLGQIKESERIDAQYGFHIPGDSALAVTLNSLDEAAHAGDPEFDPRVQVARPVRRST